MQANIARKTLDFQPRQGGTFLSRQYQSLTNKTGIYSDNKKRERVIISKLPATEQSSWAKRTREAIAARYRRFMTGTGPSETRQQQLAYYISDNGFQPQILMQLLTKKFSPLQADIAQNFRIVTKQAKERLTKSQQSNKFFLRTPATSDTIPAWLNYANLQTQKISNQNTLSRQVKNMYNYILLVIYTQIFLQNVQAAQVMAFIQSVAIVHPMMSLIQVYQYAAATFASQRSYSQVIMNTQLIKGQPPVLRYRPTHVYVWDQVFIYMKIFESPHIQQIQSKLNLSMEFQVDFATRRITKCLILILGKKYAYKLDDTGVIWTIAQQIVKTKYSFTQQVYKRRAEL